jgi:hypothetical protein
MYIVIEIPQLNSRGSVQCGMARGDAYDAVRVRNFGEGCVVLHCIQVTEHIAPVGFVAQCLESSGTADL